MKSPPAQIPVEKSKVSRTVRCLFGENSMDQLTVPAQRGAADSAATLRPLCVDMDGTLLETDTMEELIVSFLRANFWRCGALPFWLLRGRAYFKRRLAEEAVLRVDLLPAQPDFVKYLEEQHASGRTLVLASAADERIVKLVAERFKIFSGVIGSDGKTNLKSQAKLRRLTELYGPKGFDYAGNSSADIAVWGGAGEAIVVNASPGVERRASKVAKVGRTFPKRAGGLESLKRLLRVHQWPKNLLLLVPLLTGHKLRDPESLYHAGLGMLSFCFAASSVYVMNDLHDLEADRLHHSKKKRPFAAGQFPMIAGLALVPGLLALAFLSAALLPGIFLVCLGVYWLSSALYCGFLKQVLLVDVFMLAGLYSIRIVAGNAATSIVYSNWLMGFSFFLFLGLAMLKRYIELRRLGANGAKLVAGRDYRFEDLSSVFTIGIVSGYLAALVLALYINSEEVRKIYNHPALLLLICPVLLFWITRIWFLAARNQIDDDPVLFALKDKASYLNGALIVLVIWLAS
jgi:4-hydroxybenzoate polyprenyltransferase/phosphoserine phosphatase